VVLLTGLGLYGAVLAVLLATGNPVYVPSLLLIGAAVVPVTFSVFVSDYERAPRFTPSQVLSVAVVGGVVAALIAGPLEMETQRGLGSLPWPMIGVIEESAKLVVPVLIAWRIRGARAVDGLVVGVAVGSAFAALETMGYAFVALVATGGHVEPVTHLLVLRAAASLGGHAAWTGMTCAALFAVRESPTRRRAWLRFLVVYALASGLHAEWDDHAAHHGYLVVGAISLAGLIVAAWWLHSSGNGPGAGPAGRAWAPRVPGGLARGAAMAVPAGVAENQALPATGVVDAMTSPRSIRSSY
jgi:RsiW-degrading membrane proteinase PrsW (M82 family)